MARYGPIWLALVLLLAGRAALSAQAPAPESQSSVLAGEPWSGAGDPSQQPVILRTMPRRDLILGLASWDHTLLGAFQLGARLFHLATIPAANGVPVFGRPRTAGMGRFSVNGAGPHLSLDEIARALRIDQLERQGMNMNFNAGFGNFRIQYREVFSGRANSLGGGIGQASAAAIYTTPRFGSGKMFDFSAAALMGSGPMNQLLGRGFGTSAIGGNGPGHKSSTAPTVAIKLTF